MQLVSFGHDRCRERDDDALRDSVTAFSCLHSMFLKGNFWNSPSPLDFGWTTLKKRWWTTQVEHEIYGAHVVPSSLFALMMDDDEAGK